MDGSRSRRKPSYCREQQPLSRRRSWCCSFVVPPASPDAIAAVNHCSKGKNHSRKTGAPTKIPASSSVPSSPQSAKSLGLGMGLVGRIDPRRILSPGRVSPIDSDLIRERSIDVVVDSSSSSATVMAAEEDRPPAMRSRSFRAPPAMSSFGFGEAKAKGNEVTKFDVRLSLKGKKGGLLVLEMNSEILCANSKVFAGLVQGYNKKTTSSNEPSSSSSSLGSSKVCRIEVPEVENLAMFRGTVELMFHDEIYIAKKLVKIGVLRAIDVLEVSASIMFSKGVSSCLKYLEAVPWTEEEEEKLRDLFTRFKYDDTTTRDILARLYLLDSPDDSQQNLARQLVWSLTSSTDTNARNELKSLVKGLLCKSSVYEKDNNPDLNKEDMYAISQSCLDSLVAMFDETTEKHVYSDDDRTKPMIERVSRQVDNINWLLEILLEWQMAEEFVDMWANQEELLRFHEKASPMVRYELSRVSAVLFIAMGTRQLHCHADSRSALLQSWFGPMLTDFGWLQRCKKGLSMKSLEEAMGQTLLTLPLSQQYVLFMEWFRVFSTHGAECPNLGKAFQIWWRRSFLRGGSEAVETR